MDFSINNLDPGDECHPTNGGRGGHPFAFYRKPGFALAGVLPDANGRGKPEYIWLNGCNNQTLSKSVQFFPTYTSIRD
jgi:hypothetical protein